MASYVVLARKWRPAQFEDIVGQSPVVRTLMNAIRAERIHHAYLLTGSRGIGKTSIARIFSKAIRCEKTSFEKNWLRSCDQCSACHEIATSSSIDVIEVDGASNNGVDAVREIRESAKFLPAAGKWKLYIIDEVHMLTTAAFNALLKTLEEPPPHVVFIFATTEPHKIPATILSRCQRFDLRRVTVAQIQERLSHVIEEEGIEAESGALVLLARAAEGSMRDALSLLDQVSAFAGNQITAQAVRDSIGLLGGQVLLGVLKGVLERKPLDALSFVNQAYQSGHDLRVLTRSLIDFLHSLILLKLGFKCGVERGTESVVQLECSQEELEELQALVPLRPLEELELIFQVLHYGVDSIARSPQPKTVLDILLIKCAAAELLVNVSDTSDSSRDGPPMPPSPASVTGSRAVHADNWEGFIAFIRQSRPLLASILDHGVCLKWPNSSEKAVGAILSIGFPSSNAYFHKQIQSQVYSEQLSVLGQQYFLRPVRIEAQLMEAQDAQGESVAFRRERERAEKEKAAREAVAQHPLIREAKSLFGGELGAVEIFEREGGTV